MGLERQDDGTLKITTCKGFCQNKSNDSICGKGCRNILENSNNTESNNDISEEIIFTKEYYYNKLDNILKDLY